MYEKVKIRFDLDVADWHKTPSEVLWGALINLDEKGATLALENTPFLVKGVSYLDVVYATRTPRGILHFDHVVSRAGHSTYRLISRGPKSLFEQQWRAVQSLGCTYESGEIEGRRVFAVDIPPETNIHEVYSLLQRGEDEGIWIFEEGHVGQPTGRQ